jgi:predicted DNA-binding WGR domain protein
MFVEGGSNKFYKLQLLEGNSEEVWWVLKKWGPIGFDGRSRLNAYDSLAEAKKDFQKTFNNKTKQLEKPQIVCSTAEKI